MQIVINAGGNGTRLWPISTSTIPKQFCKLLDDKSLLQTTFNRILIDFPVENIWVNTNEKHIELVKEQLPTLNPSHILTEPQRRDTFPAVAANAAIIAGFTSEDEPITFVNSDHYIAPQTSVVNHNKALKLIAETLKKDVYDVIVAGIKPNLASERYGYIEISSGEKEKCYTEIVKVASFREKPSREKAEEYLKRGNYFWNLGSFSLTYRNLKKNIETLYPQTVESLNNIYKNKAIDLEGFRKLPKISFDYAILEQVSRLGMVGMELEIWDDLGSFDSLYQYLPSIKNHADIDKDIHQIDDVAIEISGQGNKVKILDGTKKIAFVGVSNLVLVEDKEGILIINPDKAGDVKKIAEYFDKN